MYLNHLNLKGKVFERICDFLCDQEDMYVLNLSNNSIQDEEAVYLAEKIPEYPNLRFINLSFNAISDEGAMALYTAIQLHASIRVLSLNGNEIGKHILNTITSFLDKRTCEENKDLGSSTYISFPPLEDEARTVKKSKSRGLKHRKL